MRLIKHIESCEKNHTMCSGCDMGEAGYSSRGGFTHDDDCFFYEAKQEIERLESLIERLGKMIITFSQDTELSNLTNDEKETLKAFVNWKLYREYKEGS